MEFFGHLHPVLVHLPIGLLLLACLFLWQSKKDKYAHLQASINLILCLGMISAIVCCITGYILAQTGDYEENSIVFHMWMGISVAIVSIITFYSRKRSSLKNWQLPLALLLVILILITGHLGGSITHGSDYLTQPLQSLFSADTVVSFRRKPIPKVQEAFLYDDIIQPIFQEKCYGCHGIKKQKGKLRLDKPDYILKGGKDGVVIVPGKSGESELIKRILLPREDEHHMAPKEKPQLSAQEIFLLKWWVDNNADFTKEVKDIPQTEKIKTYLNAIQHADQERKPDRDIPAAPVEQGDGRAIDKLKALGITVVQVAQNNNYLSVNFDTGIPDPGSAIPLLLPLEKQLVWLKLSNIKLKDSSWAMIAQFQNLRKLELDHSNIQDGGLAYLKSLKQLTSLNLVGTGITDNGLMQLKELRNLEYLYLYQTNIKKSGWPLLKQIFPKTQIDSGGYIVPLLQTDTIVVKPPPAKN
jgi:uncharacterized membrane protein/mono/diheme cytochrome c family protein